MSKLIEVRVPDLGESKDVAVIEILVKAGDAIEVESPLLTLETDKATMDLPSPLAGEIDSVSVAVGAKVNKGDVIAVVRVAEGAGSAAPSTAAPAPAAAPVPSQSPSPTPAPTPARSPATAPVVSEPLPAASAARADLAEVDHPEFSHAYAGPSVRRLARELGVNLDAVKGTGNKGRIGHDDVKAYVKRALTGGAAPGAAGDAGLPSVPVVDFAAFGPVEVKPLNRVQRISGPRLHAAWVNLPHVTQFDEADITELEEVRAKLKQRATQSGVKLTPLAFIVRACVRALAEFPSFNASLDESGQNLVFKRYCHIGFAADTPNGLLVPVIRDADRRDIYELARELADLSAKARAGKLTAAEMQGGCFTISSLGGIGGTAFTPIINAPEVAILGVSRAAMRPVFSAGSFVPRLMLPLSLSYDHRVIDGALAARFTTYLAARLAEVRGLLEAVP